MRTLATILALVILGFGLGGCANNLASQELQVQEECSLATTAALAAVPNVTDRANAARLTYEISSDIQTAIASNQTINLAQLEALANTELEKSDPAYAPVIGSILLTVENAVQVYVSQYWAQANSTQQGQAVVGLIKAGVAGVAATSQAYTQGTPGPVSGTEKINWLTVHHYQYQKSK